MSQQYSELFCQSNYSFLEGASHAEELVLQADFLRYKALAVTDECSLAGIVKVHSAIKQHKLSLKQIVGSMFWLNEECQVILICPNREAYAELCRIITNARRRSSKGHYQLSEWDIMSAKHCFIVWLPQQKNEDAHWGQWLSQHHSGRLWIGLQRHLKQTDQQYIDYCVEMSHHHQLPITACGGVLMHNANRLPLQHSLTAIKYQKPITEVGSHLLANAERCLRSINKLSHIFKVEWLEESNRISELCEFELDSLRYEYPSELIPQGETPMSYLRMLVEKGKRARFPQGVPNDIQQIIEKELGLIDELDYPFFFLTIHDIVMFAKSQGILYQGRGSAANSVVCYCLEITSVDPRQISVLFERFISKERDEPPDIDVDFEHERREEVIQYIYKKYGRERAALAATVISYRFKSAVRDVGKALGLQETQLDYFIKNTNRRDKSLGWQAQLTQLGLQPDSLKGQQFIHLVNEIIGFPRHLSQHVGGFVISSGPLYELVPVENAAMHDRTIIQWDKDDLETLGLLKVDVLALGMLSAIRKCFDLIKRIHGRSLTIAEITRLKDDPQVYGMIQRADTVGIFQIESRAQMSMLPRLKPRTYYDLVIQIAIVRPGPIQGDMVHPFLKRRDGIEPISYPSKDVKSVLSRTLGVPIFQEQVIKLAMVAAGFTGGEADQLRRAMAAWKKNGNVFKFKNKLIEGMQNRGYETEFAEQIFKQICGFGEYGFPESHSASFAVLAYCSAWLKCYYPECFYASLLNSQPMGFYSPSQLVQDAQRHNVAILPVCVNTSQDNHIVVEHQNGLAIRLGLRQIKGFSEHGIQSVLANRPHFGYRHPSQVKQLSMNKRDIELLASANALHNVSGDRFQTRWAMMDSASDLPLFSQVHDDIKHSLHQPSEMQNLLEDFSSVGISLNKHPITLLEETNRLGRFTHMKDLKQQRHKSMVTVVGLVTGKQSPGTAAGVTFVTLEDNTGNINVVVWGATARAQQQAYLTAKALKVQGVLEKEGEVVHVIAGKLIDITDEITGLNTKSRDFH
ncbi:error-prone DNA polymerase [Vibrio cyclitrophicus 1F53]|uniref:error-prone DNA polymerase n=1 Tax=Vibrio cyclitrophicus TaxID=47951 RepID=UPI000312977D|nr:error-prone DNA polymerase [Vibrio cyclitrophicus]ERM60390.1 Error-prone repair protein of DNA polymerase III alpha subunit [Vibrio cyclitrophicus FF75]OEE45235.1 error-prone DNA polymerase [Vibrio cyclitrophicus FF75]OEF31543.1 error-prone DNA polymerase [Vibrio cyclitrophicus 1F53]OEF65489.1 error-prone DNA polymerase [Vibrio cyclitrophicus 1F175]PMH34467.1 error-prone DNA polymerase [Vibrio cyclitrophicus]